MSEVLESEQRVRGAHMINAEDAIRLMMLRPVSHVTAARASYREEPRVTEMLVGIWSWKANSMDLSVRCQQVDSWYERLYPMCHMQWLH